MAPRDVKAGAQYADAIVKAINEVRAVVLVLSGSAGNSQWIDVPKLGIPAALDKLREALTLVSGSSSAAARTLLLIVAKNPRALLEVA
jgi:hypothetical protein